MNIKQSIACGAIASAIAFLFPTYTIPLLIGVLVVSIFELNNKIELLINTHLERDEKDKKVSSDIKTLFDNQRLLLSLLNAVRIRINNFYAKKLKDPKARFQDIDIEKEFSLDGDEGQDSI
jgi:hypothetical protein